MSDTSQRVVGESQTGEMVVRGGGVVFGVPSDSYVPVLLSCHQTGV